MVHRTDIDLLPTGGLVAIRREGHTAGSEPGYLVIKDALTIARCDTADEARALAIEVAGDVNPTLT